MPSKSKNFYGRKFFPVDSRVVRIAEHPITDTLNFEEDPSHMQAIRL